MSTEQFEPQPGAEPQKELAHYIMDSAILDNEALWAARSLLQAKVLEMVLGAHPDFNPDILRAMDIYRDVVNKDVGILNRFQDPEAERSVVAEVAARVRSELVPRTEPTIN